MNRGELIRLGNCNDKNTEFILVFVKLALDFLESRLNGNCSAVAGGNKNSAVRRAVFIPNFIFNSLREDAIFLKEFVAGIFFLQIIFADIKNVGIAAVRNLQTHIAINHRVEAQDADLFESIEIIINVFTGKLPDKTSVKRALRGLNFALNRSAVKIADCG